MLENLTKAGVGYFPMLMICTLCSVFLMSGNGETHINPATVVISESKFSLDSARSKNTSTLRRIEEKCKQYELIKR